MLARLHVLLPFSVQMPVGEPFTVFEYVQDGYNVRVFLPVKIDVPNGAGAGTMQNLVIDGRPAESYNGLRIDFHKEEFDRTEGSESDPPDDFMAEAVNSYLVRLRHVTGAAKVRAIDLRRTTWRLRYLNDDETELEGKQGQVRGRGGLAFHFDFIGVTKEVWNDVHGLDPEFQGPIWNSLLLDAQDALPQIGPSIVLASTALEVFVSLILDELAKRSAVPEELWNWINTRDLLRLPSTEEQFDKLLKILMGYSLKEDSQLWQAFQNLRSARNTFVHEGVARIGKVPATQHDAQRLLGRAVEIVQAVRTRLPDEFQWKEFKYDIKMGASWKIFGEEPEAR